MILKITVTIIMFGGLYGTVFPHFPGTLVILSGAGIYWFFTGFATYQPWLFWVLLALAALTEVGGGLLRVFLTRRAEVTRRFSTDTTGGNIAGLIVSDAVLGPVIGTILWRLTIGKTLLPRWTSVSEVLRKLVFVAGLRFLCAGVMILLIIHYVFCS